MNAIFSYLYQTWFALGQYSSAGKMGGILDGKPSDGPKFMHSYTGEGAMQAIEEFQRNGRKDYKVTKLLLLMSDGPASDPIQASKAVSRTMFEIMY